MIFVHQEFFCFDFYLFLFIAFNIIHFDQVLLTPGFAPEANKCLTVVPASGNSKHKAGKLNKVSINMSLISKMFALYLKGTVMNTR